jgi:hypothetical protein
MIDMWCFACSVLFGSENQKVNMMLIIKKFVEAAATFLQAVNRPRLLPNAYFFKHLPRP